MVRLPQPGADVGSWGTILNDFLSQIHKADGTLKDNTVSATTLAPGAVNTAALQDNAVAGTKISDATIPETKLDSALLAKINAPNGSTTLAGLTDVAASGAADGQSLTYSQAAGKWVSATITATGSVADATTGSRGIVQLAGDLAGTAAAPTVPGLATKQATIAPGTTAQYYRGDKTWQTLDKTAVGLGNVDNTTDLAKPISTATQTALNAKASTASLALVATSGSYNDLTSKPTIPTVTDATAAAKGIVQLAGDLAGTAASPTVPGLANKAATATTISTTNSLTGGGDLSANRTLSLVGDTATPGNSKYYGTDGAGTRGYFALPSGGGGSSWNIRSNVTAATVVAANNDWIIAVPSANAITVQLPAPAANARVRVKRAYAAGNSILITTPNGGMLDGGEPTMATLNAGWSGQNYESDGTNWYVV